MVQRVCKGGKGFWGSASPWLRPAIAVLLAWGGMTIAGPAVATVSVAARAVGVSSTESPNSSARDRAIVRYNRGIDHFLAGDFAAAIAEFNAAIAIDRTFPEAFQDRGNAYAASGNVLAAAADYSTAIRLDSDYANAYYNRGNLYLREERYFEAIADYDRVLELRPEDAEAMHNRALADALVGNLAEAVSGLQAAARLFQAQGDRAGVDQALAVLRALQPAPEGTPRGVAPGTIAPEDDTEGR